MPRSGAYLIAYDLSEDRERGRVARVLGSYGVRQQYSVFECRLTRSALGRLEKDLETLGLQSGWVGVYRLQSSFEPRRIGAVPEPGPTDEERYGWVV